MNFFKLIFIVIFTLLKISTSLLRLHHFSLKCFKSSTKSWELFTAAGSTYVHTSVNDDGIYEMPNGDVYEGWLFGGVYGNMRHGMGKQIYIDGRTFVGEWKNDSELIGTMTYTDNTTYRGQFSNSLREGYGTLYYENGLYEGHWIANKREGIGRLTFNFDGNSSNSYTGHFVDDFKFGGFFGGFFD